LSVEKPPPAKRSREQNSSPGPQRVVHAGLKVLVAHLATAVADQPPIMRQQLRLRQTEEGR
jgi:hypothetical protein